MSGLMQGLELAVTIDENDRDERAAKAFVDPRTLPTRYSLLKTLEASPAHYLEACQQEQDDSLASRLGAFASDRKEAYRIGGAIHAMLIDGKVVVYSGRRDPRVKAWQEFQAEAAAQGVAEILIASEMVIVQGVVDAIRARPDAMKLLFDGTLREKRIDWGWMGKAVRSTPDARVPGKYVVDLKSAMTSSIDGFRRQNRRFLYHAQAELYAHAMEAVGEGRPADSFVIAVEKSRPHPVTIFRFSAEMLELGAKLNRKWMERLLQCEQANSWPGYTQVGTIADLDLEEGWEVEA